MKKIFTLFICAGLFGSKANSQLMLNELYTDPGAGKHEFFEIYNTTFTSFSTDNLTMVTFFEISGTKGFYVMDMPNQTIGSRGYYVGASSLPFNYQGVIGSTRADFNWNSATFTANSGYLKKWVPGVANLLDGNLFYDQAALPANFNDFFYRRTANGASYTVFLYQNGILVNSFVGGTGGNTTILNDIVNMPNLHVDMSASSTDFTINFSGYGSVPVEYCIQDAGSDNGYIREGDGQCGAWVKSSAQVQHTPKMPNGYVGGSDGVIAVESALARGTAATGSTVTYNVVSAPAIAFPVTINIYLDNGIVTGFLDSMDTYVAANIENVVGDGPFTTLFFPYNANVLVVVKSAIGCVDKVIYIPNAPVLDLELLSFNGIKNNQFITLTWTVDENESALKYEIEKSIDGGDFIQIASIIPIQDFGQRTYHFADPVSNHGRTTYRIKLTDKNGKFFYSSDWSCLNSMTNPAMLKLLGNPVQDVLQFSYEAKTSGVISINIINSVGMTVYSSKQAANPGKTSTIAIPLNEKIKPGMYILTIIEGPQRHTGSFIKG